MKPSNPRTDRTATGSDPATQLEAISALCDGELAAAEASFLLRRIAQDRALQIHWTRMHRLRACIQHEYPGPVSLVEAVRARLEDEPVPVGGASRWTSQWLRYGFGAVVAASVAVIALVGLINRVDPHGSDVEHAPAFVSQTTALDRQFSRRVEPAGFGGARREAAALQISEQQRINRMMIQHSQLVGGNAFISLTPVLAAPAAVAPLQAGPAERTTDPNASTD